MDKINLIEELPKGGHATGKYLKYDWLVVRHSTLGHLCGYVKLWKNHPLEISISNSRYDKLDIDCHGGVTFARGVEAKDKFMVDHGFTPGYWFGWDYAHLGDWVDYSIPSFQNPEDHRWTLEEVIRECHKVIGQLTEKYT